ncbi:MAG: hypothetical protein Phog2KO_14830 [Phototrophicaceae bacterium]
MNEQEQIKSFIEQELLIGREIEVGYDDDLLLSGLVNSLGVMRLVAFTNENFDIEVPPEDITIEHFETINAIVNYLTSNNRSKS